MDSTFPDTVISEDDSLENANLVGMKDDLLENLPCVHKTCPVAVIEEKLPAVEEGDASVIEEKLIQQRTRRKGGWWHRPHHHNPHRYNPHRHNPHRHTPPPPPPPPSSPPPPCVAETQYVEHDKFKLSYKVFNCTADAKCISKRESCIAKLRSA